jgi:hypothetical protein
MSTGADAMGVAAWLTPALIVAVAAGLAHPAVGQPADAAPPASAAPAELIDPDCDPAAAEKADPLLVEEPDGVCSPEEPEGVGDGPPSKPDSDMSPPAADSAASHDPPPEEPQLSPAPPAPGPVARAPAPRARPTLDSRHGPGPEPEAVRPKRRAGERSPESPAREEGGHRPAAERRGPGGGRGRAGGDHRRTEGEHRRTGGERERDRSAAEPIAPTYAHRSPHPSKPTPIMRFPRASLDAPDPLPRARRLKPRFARRLERIAERSGAPWALMLAVRRARGHDGAVPAGPERLRVLARRLVRLGVRKNPRRAVRRLVRAIALRADPERPRPLRRHALVKRVVALAHLNRAIGLRGLVRGLKRVKERLARRLLDSRRLVIYPGGRHDVGSGFTDVRVLVLLRYLASRYREVTVSSLTTGHSFFTASGNVSAHSYGQAVDIAALNGRPILGNQEPGGLTEHALHQIMLLPERLEPSELISLFELGGPSFALADHADHIHVGY